MRYCSTLASSTIPSRSSSMGVGRLCSIAAGVFALMMIMGGHAEEDYRFLPTPVGGGQDVSYYINAACRSGSRLYMGGVFNLVGQDAAFNFGYFENGNWTSPPVTIGSDPMTLLYDEDGIQSAHSQGKVLALACPPPLPDGSTVVIIGGEFTQGGLRLGGAGGLPFVGPDGPRVLHHLAIFRVEANNNNNNAGDEENTAETSNLCPVIVSGGDQPPQSSSEGGLSSLYHGWKTESNPEDQYSKISCSPGVPKSDVPPGVHLYHSPNKLTGSPDANATAYISAITCLNHKCTDLIVGGSFNSILGTTAYSIARLTFDDNFYVAQSTALHEVKGWTSFAEIPVTPPGSWSFPSRSMGGFQAPIPGVDGAVHAIEVLNDRYVVIAGHFHRAGAVNAPSVILWDRLDNNLFCLGREEGGGDCYSTEFCCHGIPGDIRTVTAISPSRFLLGGSFADASGPSGIISANLAIVELTFDSTLQQHVNGWRRLQVVDEKSGNDVGTNGPITSALCVEEGANDDNICSKVLLGGWFDGLQSFAWNASTGGLSVTNATSEGLLSYPLAMLTLPSSSVPSSRAPAILKALDIPNVYLVNGREEEIPSSSEWTRPSIGINALVRVPMPSTSKDVIQKEMRESQQQVQAQFQDMATVFAGKLTSVGNVAALIEMNEGVKSESDIVTITKYAALPLVQMASPESGGPLCWESQDQSLFISEEKEYPPTAHGASASFCCFVGSLCPYEGIAVNCPQSGGFYCLPNMTMPDCCEQGSYCPTPGTVTMCETGQYCPPGSTTMKPCTWWMWCKKPGLDRPDKIMAGVIALVLVASIFIFVSIVNWTYLRCRTYFRQARDNDRRGKGLMTARGTHHQQYKDGNLTEPLLQKSLSSSRRSCGSLSPIKSARRRKDGGPPERGVTFIGSPDQEGERRQSGEAIVAPQSPPLPVSSSSRVGRGSDFHPRDSSADSRTTSEATMASGGPFAPLMRERHKVDRVDLNFEGLTVELPGRKKVLNAVTGGFRAGRVTAVMGPSGCGKTTLISALSNRLGLGTKVTGTTYINGTAESATALHDLMGFVPQDDIMYEDLTVKENLTYCCQLRADPSMTKKEQEQHVEKVIDSLGLFPSRHSIIGSTEDRGISGGQRKRVNVGMELTSKPLILFLDEPTSGLDSTTAEELMQYLHRLTATGLTIAAVIHQPRIEVFLGVDDVIFLGRGGRVAYYGAAKDAVQYFKGQGYAFEPTVNPADRILDIITKSDDSLYEKWQTNIKRQSEQQAGLGGGAAMPVNGQGNFGFWNPRPPADVVRLPVPTDRDSISSTASDDQQVGGGVSSRPPIANRQNRRGVVAGGAAAAGSGGGGAAGGPSGRTTSVGDKRGGGRRPSTGGIEGRRSPMMMVVYEEQLLPSRRYPAFHSQAWTCLCRSLVQQHNNLVIIQHDLYLLMTFGLLVGLFDLGIKQYELSVLCMGLTSTLTGVRFFSTERVVFWRECSSGISIPAYYLGKVLSAVPITVLYPLAYLSFYYNMGFPRVSFTFYYLVLLWAGWVCFGVGVIMSLIFEPKNAQIGGVVIALVGFLFGGHNPNVVTLEKTAPGKIGMLLSYVRWSIGALLLQDASLLPQCGVFVGVSNLAREGFLSQDIIDNSLPQTFQPRVVDTEVSHCRQMLINICILYLTFAMVLMWLSGKYRARMIGWDYFKTGMKQWRVRLRERLYLCLQRNHGWLPTWVIDALVGGKYESMLEEEEYEDEDEYYDEGEGGGMQQQACIHPTTTTITGGMSVNLQAPPHTRPPSHQQPDVV